MRALAAVALCIAVAGCQTYTNEPVMLKRNKEQNYYRVVVDEIIYSNYNDIQAVCGKGFVGCFRCKEEKCQIWSIDRKCVLDHEWRHIRYGYFHLNERAECEAVPSDYARKS